MSLAPLSSDLFYAALFAAAAGLIGASLSDTVAREMLDRPAVQEALMNHVVPHFVDLPEARVQVARTAQHG